MSPYFMRRKSRTYIYGTTQYKVLRLERLFSVKSFEKKIVGKIRVEYKNKMTGKKNNRKFLSAISHLHTNFRLET